MDNKECYINLFPSLLCINTQHISVSPRNLVKENQSQLSSFYLEVLQNLQKDNKNQSIICLGDKGSGKTVETKRTQFFCFFFIFFVSLF